MSIATFQSTVQPQMGFGIPGEIFDSGPYRADPYLINSLTSGGDSNAANNYFGRAFSVTLGGSNQGSQTIVGTAAVGNVNGTYPFAGILVAPKDYALTGDGTNALNPSLTLPNGVIGQFLNQGSVIVQFGGTAQVGQLVVFDNNTGVLGVINSDVPIPSGKSPAYAYVTRYNVSTGYAVIVLTRSVQYVLA